MKIAVVGKGGSGKSSVSWALSHFIAEKDGYVAMIDSDHNMDLSSLSGYIFDSDSPSFHRLHDEFRSVVGQKEDKAWHNIVLDGRELPQFSLRPDMDSFSKSVFVPLSDSMDLAVVGLGGDDILFSDRCAHGHSAPLKYYLPLLDANQYDVVVDGVAGADMLNAGVYTGVDVVCVVIEPQPNSVRVAKQVISIAQELGIPYCVVMNKPNGSELQKEISLMYSDVLAGVLPIDPAVMAAVFSGLTDEAKNEIKNVHHFLHSRFGSTDSISRLRNFESRKREARM